MARILIIRLSAIGDVAMTIPVIYSAAKSNPDDRFTILTQGFLVPLFVNPPSNVAISGINLRGAEKSLTGLLRFARKFSKYDFDIVLDLHDVIRSVMIRSFFYIKRTKIYVIDKSRKERTPLTARFNKILQPLRKTTDRYADVFKSAGLSYTESFHSLFDEQPADLSHVEKLTGKKQGKWIGIAPFAKHRGKIYPMDKMEQLIVLLSKKEHVSLFLFGAKGDEEAVLKQWAAQHPNTHCIAGLLPLNDELALLSRLDVLLSMDSANMHFASLVKTPVVSVWGATHPYAGFYGYRQKPENAVQINLHCRPCSIYGKEPCFRGDWACMTQLPPETILAKIEENLT